MMAVRSTGRSRIRPNRPSHCYDAMQIGIRPCHEVFEDICRRLGTGYPMIWSGACRGRFALGKDNRNVSELPTTSALTYDDLDVLTQSGEAVHQLAL